MKTRTQPIERRARRRFGLPLTVQFRLTRKGSTSHWDTGTIHDMSSNGISFQCRGPLPVGCRLELNIAWPATRGAPCLTQLHATGFVVRSSAAKAAVQIAWHRLCIEPAAEMALSAIA